MDVLEPAERRRVGPYLLVARLGSGGMGDVYLGRDADAVRGAAGRAPVAVKTVRQHLALDQEFRARFRREVAAAQAVRHPRVARLLAADPEARRPWLATEYVPGPTLAEAVRRCGPLPEPTVRAFGVHLLGALQAMHAAQVLHRDLKPANVLLAADGPKVIDFGIAQILEGTALTATGAVVGTPGFMSPEHLTGERTLGPASDVFSLGAVMCFAATGEGPFEDGELASVVYRMMEGAAELSRVPGPLRETIAACLHPSPRRRPAAGELLRMLAPGGAADLSDAPIRWPRQVRSLGAEHERAVRQLMAERLPVVPAAHRPPTAAGGATTAPLQPTQHFAAAVPVPAGRRASRTRRRRLLGGVAAAGLLLAAGLTVPQLLDDPSATPDPPVGTPRKAVADPSAAPAALSGGTGNSGEFGTAAMDADRRPNGWMPWSRRTGTRLSGCASGGELLVCQRADGGTLALSAGTGSTRWQRDPTTPLGKKLDDGMVAPPVVSGSTVYTTDGSWTRALRLRDGKPLWRKRAAGPGKVAVLTLHTKGIVLSYQIDPADPVLRGGNTATATARMSARLTAHRASDGKELWQHSLSTGQTASPVVLNTRVYLMESGRLTALNARTGEQTARSSRPTPCSELTAHRTGVVCATQQRGDGTNRTDVFDPDDLSARGAVPAARGIRFAALGEAGVLIGVTGGNALVGIDPDSGRELWRKTGSAEDNPGTPWDIVLSGEHAIRVTDTSASGFPVNSGPKQDDPAPRTYRGWPDQDPDQRTELATTLITASTLYAAFTNGTVISGYAP